MTRGPAKTFDPDDALLRAIEVFWTKGYAAAGLSDLLDAMGIARKSMYDTFGCKRELFLAALDAYSRHAAEGMRAELCRSGSPLQDLRRFLRERQREFASPGTRGCLLGVAAAQADTDDVELARALNAYLRTVEDVIHDALVRARDAGELVAGADPRAFARLIVATLQGLAVTGRVVAGAAFAKGAIDALLAAIGDR